MPSNHLILCCPLLLLPSIFLSIRSFPMSELFTLGGQSTGALAWASVLPMNIQGWFPLGWTGLNSLLSKGLSRVFSSTTVQKPWVLWHSVFFMVQHSHPYTSTGKTIALTIWTFNSFSIIEVWFHQEGIEWLLCVWHLRKQEIQDTALRKFQVMSACVFVNSHSWVPY